MKKIVLLTFAVLFLSALAGCGMQKNKISEPPISAVPSENKMEKQKPNSSEIDGQFEDTSMENWQSYDNTAHGYSLQYPPNWFYLEDACCPPPPAFVNFNNVSTKMSELGEAQATQGATDSIDILCIYEADLDQIGEVRSFKDEGAENEPVQINGFPGIKITTPAGPDSDLKVLTYYLSNPGTSSCRITFRDSCQECSKILQSFTFFK